MLFLAPAGYYTGWVNPHWAFVLYSGQLPHALHSSKSSLKRLDGWTGLTVPFPDSPRLYREVFRLTGKPGDKLHVFDPRFAKRNNYYVFGGGGKVREITRAEFHRDTGSGGVGDVELESRNSTWKLARLGAKVERDELRVATGIVLSGKMIEAGALRELVGLPNLREVKIENAVLDDRTLGFAAELPRLEILELKGVSLSPASLASLESAPSLHWLRIEGVSVPGEALGDIGKLAQLEVLHLVNIVVDADSGAAALDKLIGLTKLKWLDLSHSSIDDSSLAVLENFVALEILDLSSTSVGGTSLASLAKLKNLEVLKLGNTRIGNEQLATLVSQLPDCRIER